MQEVLVPGRDLLLEPRPLVENLHGLQQETLRRDRQQQGRVVVHDRFLTEAKFPVLPAKRGQDDPSDLEAERFPQVFDGKKTVPQEDRAQALRGLLLELQGADEPLGRELAAADQEFADPFLQARGLGVGRNDLSREKGDSDRVLAPADGQDSRLLLKPEHLEDVGHGEGAQRAFKAHASASRPTRAIPPKAPRRRRARRRSVPSGRRA